MHSLTHQPLHLPRCIKTNPFHGSQPSVLFSSPLLGIRQHRGTSQILREMVFSLWTRSRSNPCLLTPGRAGHPWVAPVPVSKDDPEQPFLPPSQGCSHRTEVFCTLSRIFLPVQFTFRAITSVLQTSCMQNQRKARLVHMQLFTIATHRLPCQSHTWQSFGSERFEPEQRQTRTVKTHKAYGEELRHLICGLKYTELVISELPSHKQLINHHALITTRGDKLCFQA